MLAVDWGYFWTAFVGFAGICGSVLSAIIARKSAEKTLQTSIAAENRRGRLAGKRSVYAQALAALTAYERSGARKEGRAEPIAVAMYSAVQEVRLIAPQDVADLALRAEDLAWRGSTAFPVGLMRWLMPMIEDVGCDKVGVAPSADRLGDSGLTQ